MNLNYTKELLQRCIEGRADTPNCLVEYYKVVYDVVDDLLVLHAENERLTAELTDMDIHTKMAIPVIELNLPYVMLSNDTQLAAKNLRNKIELLVKYAKKHARITPPPKN